MERPEGQDSPSTCLVVDTGCGLGASVLHSASQPLVDHMGFLTGPGQCSKWASLSILVLHFLMSCWPKQVTWPSHLSQWGWWEGTQPLLMGRVAKCLWSFLIYHCGPPTSKFQGKWHFRQGNYSSQGPGGHYSNYDNIKIILIKVMTY